MKVIELNNWKLNILDIKTYVENNEVYTKIESCDRKEAQIKVVVKDRNNANKRTQYTNYYKYI